MICSFCIRLCLVMLVNLVHGVQSQLTITEAVQRWKLGQSANITCQGIIDPYDDLMAFYKLNTNRKDDIRIREPLTFMKKVQAPYVGQYDVDIKRSSVDLNRAIYTIQITSLSVTDDGYYMCAQVKHSTKEILHYAVAQLIVLQPVQGLTLKIGKYTFNSDRVNENIYKSDVFTPVTLTCESSGSNPQPNMQIKIGGTDVSKRAQDADHTSVIGSFPNQERRHAYRLKLTMTESDAGKDIECIASVKGLTKKSKVVARFVVSIHGQDCDFVACSKALTPFDQQRGSFSVTKFEQTCSLFPSVSACMESKMGRCVSTKKDRFTWELKKDVMQLTCSDRRSDYLELARCMDTQENIAAKETCDQQMQSDISGGANCRQLRAHLDCITNAVKSCGEKAVDIMYTVTHKVLVSYITFLEIDGCLLGSPTVVSSTVVTTNAGPAGPTISVFSCFISALLTLYH